MSPWWGRWRSDSSTWRWSSLHAGRRGWGAWGEAGHTPGSCYEGKMRRGKRERVFQNSYHPVYFMNAYVLCNVWVIFWHFSMKKLSELETEYGRCLQFLLSFLHKYIKRGSFPHCKSLKAHIIFSKQEWNENETYDNKVVTKDLFSVSSIWIPVPNHMT